MNKGTKKRTKAIEAASHAAITRAANCQCVRCKYLNEQPVRAQAFADGQPISDSDIPIPGCNDPDHEEALNKAARGE